MERLGRGITGVLEISSFESSSIWKEEEQTQKTNAQTLLSITSCIFFFFIKTSWFLVSLQRVRNKICFHLWTNNSSRFHFSASYVVRSSPVCFVCLIHARKPDISNGLFIFWRVVLRYLFNRVGTNSYWSFILLKVDKINSRILIGTEMHELRHYCSNEDHRRLSIFTLHAVMVPNSLK